MNRAHNFFAGPAILPVEVLEKARDAAWDFNNLGVSILEISHRSKDFEKVIQEAQADCLEIAGLSAADYSVIFVGGGASQQFLTVPTNFLNKKAEYINTGVWATKAYKEAVWVAKQRNLAVKETATSKDANFNYIPKGWKVEDDSDYVHITTNNTIYGTELKETPDVSIPIIADMSSNMFSRPYDFSKYSLIYAGAQKNIGPAGVVMAIIKKDWLEKCAYPDVPTMLNYKTHVKEESLFNTPPVFPIYVVGQTLKWILKKGGLVKIEEMNAEKAGYIYGAIDTMNDFYKGAVKDVVDRSFMNITFNLPTPELEDQFVKEAKALNMLGLKGHRSVGGVRASVYNACPMESVQALSKFMETFYKANK